MLGVRVRVQPQDALRPIARDPQKVRDGLSSREMEKVHIRPIDREYDALAGRSPNSNRVSVDVRARLRLPSE